MIKKRKSSTAKKILAVCLALILGEGAYLLFFSSGDAPKSVKAAISKAVDDKGLVGSKAELAKLQAALMSYRTQKGKFPASLKEMIPDYIDKIPLDPDTRDPIAYKLEDGKPIVGVPKSDSGQGGGADSITTGEQKALIATLADDPTNRDYVYSAEGKRDPFLPFDFLPRLRPGATVLEQYTFDQLKVTAILGSADQPAAMIEDASGKGYTVRKGTKIGPNGGEIAEILPDKVVVLETEEDFTGQRKDRTVEMLLRQGER